PHYATLPLIISLPTSLPTPCCPYTTLFRSRCSESARLSRYQEFGRSAPPALSAPWRRSLESPGWPRTPAGRQLPTGSDPRGPSLDRKSTRLNSSHVKISYAVFCLKKKKTLL